MRIKLEGTATPESETWWIQINGRLTPVRPTPALVHHLARLAGLIDPNPMRKWWHVVLLS